MGSGIVGLIKRVVRGSVVRRAQVIRAGLGEGLRFDPGQSNSEYVAGSNEPPVQSALGARLGRGCTFYDIGANVGFFSMIGARLVGPGGRVVAFEPVPGNAALVRANANANGFQNVRVVQMAVSDINGEADLALAAYSGGSALVGTASPPDTIGTIRVEVSRLDDVIDRLRLPVPELVKIDVEGAEFEVLKGMQRTVLAHHPTILLELDDDKAEALDRKTSACVQWLTAHGYSVADMPESYPGNRWLVRHFLATPAVDGGRDHRVAR
jgi:FkbM family methyltransferase